MSHEQSRAFKSNLVPFSPPKHFFCLLWLTVHCIHCIYLFIFCSVLVPCYLVASHAVAVENADLLILLAGHVVQALVGLHIAYLSRIQTETTVSNTVT